MFRLFRGRLFDSGLFLSLLFLNLPLEIPLIFLLIVTFSFVSLPFSLLRKYNIRVEDIMVRDVRYITLNCCYRDLHNVLLTGHLKTLALVESAGEAQTYIHTVEREKYC